MKKSRSGNSSSTQRRQKEAKDRPKSPEERPSPRQPRGGKRAGGPTRGRSAPEPADSFEPVADFGEEGMPADSDDRIGNDDIWDVFRSEEDEEHRGDSLEDWPLDRCWEDEAGWSDV